MRRWLRPEFLFALALLAVLALGPVFFGGTIGIFLTFVIVLCLAYSWNIVGGIIGELSIAHIAAWGIGGYGMILASRSDVPAVPAIAGLVLVAVAFSAAVVMVALVLRLEGLYLAVFTLVIAEIVIAAAHTSAALGRNEGIRLFPEDRLAIGSYHLIGLALVVVVMVVNHLVLRGGIGLRWLALRDDAVAAQAMGVAVRKEKVLAYALAGGLAALGGAFQAHYLGFAQPATALSIPLLVVAILCVYAGGPGTLLGPAIGALLIQGLASVANMLSTDVAVARLARLAQYTAAFLLIRAVVSKAGGEDLIAALTRKRDGAAPDEADAAAATPSRVRPRPSPLAAAPETLRVERLAKSFDGLQVLSDVSFALRESEFVALVGPNGAGKTTVCNIISGFLQPSGGRVLFRGQDLAGARPHRRFEAGIVRTFQTPRLFPRLTVLDNVAVACGGDRARAAEALARVGITAVRQKASDATLFERRMVEVARALGAEAELLILDEPLAGLSPQQRDTILGAVSDEVRGQSSVLIIEHLIPVIAPVVDRMVVLASSVVLADGMPSVVLSEPAVIESYLGQPVG